MNCLVFLTKHFMVNAVSFHPLLLLLDGHSTHFEPKSLEFARKNKIIVFCLPPHTTHVCQPLDCSFFKPLKDYWRDECHKFYQKNPGLVISKYNFCGIFREAWLKAISPSKLYLDSKKQVFIQSIGIRFYCHPTIQPTNRIMVITYCLYILYQIHHISARFAISYLR